MGDFASNYTKTLSAGVHQDSGEKTDKSWT